MIEIKLFFIKLTIVFILSIIGFLLGNLFPLAKKRNYSVLDTAESVLINKKSLKGTEIINFYKPIILQKANLRGSKPTRLFYEVINNNNDYLTLIYRVVWPDEVHPNFIINILYKIFRIFYYGSKKDIEIILLKIDRSSGEIIEIKYESDSSNDPDVFKSDHALVVLKYLNGKKIKETEILTQTSIEGKKQLVIPVLTWNHVFSSNIGKLTIEQEKEEFEEFNLPIFPLTDKIFKKYRFDRRSWIDYGCSINKKLPLIIGVFSGITIGILCNFFLHQHSFVFY